MDFGLGRLVQNRDAKQSEHNRRMENYARLKMPIVEAATHDHLDKRNGDRVQPDGILAFGPMPSRFLRSPGRPTASCKAGAAPRTVRRRQEEWPVGRSLGLQCILPVIAKSILGSAANQASADFKLGHWGSKQEPLY